MVWTFRHFNFQRAVGLHIADIPENLKISSSVQQILVGRQLHWELIMLLCTLLACVYNDQEKSKCTKEPSNEHSCDADDLKCWNFQNGHECVCSAQLYSVTRKPEDRFL